jgi:hypothetical protein
VIYNISLEELHPVLAETAAELDGGARWAGDALILPHLGVQLHLDSSPLMRNVSLASSGSRQSLEGWRRLSGVLGTKLQSLRVRSNPRAISFLLISLMLMAVSWTHMLRHPLELAQSMREVFEY